MNTTTKLAGIAAAAMLGLAAYWGVTHLAKLIIIFAILAAVAVVAGPAVGKLRAKVAKQEPKVLTGEEIDWAALVAQYELPSPSRVPNAAEQLRKTQGR